MKVETHVAKILSTESLILSIGLKDGIDVGDEFIIIQPGIEIVDEYTKKSLGSYDRIKAKVEITEIFENFSIAQTLTRKSAISPIIGANLLGTTTETQKLPVDSKDIQKIDTEKFDKKIRIGDKVVKI